MSEAVWCERLPRNGGLRGGRVKKLRFTGGLEVSQIRRLRQLEDENHRLKRSVADLTRENTAPKGVLPGKG
ncbi:MAG: hypothetical protein AVDCRST_MAG13-3884 [uncultured Solirubrobacteraceae bacterium]|uniref:Mobile element protein n=1 Tax=uncultured Solirubrobacteraceae bacterium TaxID=1162706 RepID=A0A6J4TPP7_9ACTN|nr:MAG: hypothetical protein AVDCRST_MAG13-3884 [uncultured Solirubrobacteraceae bacterium]